MQITTFEHHLRCPRQSCCNTKPVRKCWNRHTISKREKNISGRFNTVAHLSIASWTLRLWVIGRRSTPVNEVRYLPCAMSTPDSTTPCHMLFGTRRHLGSPRPQKVAAYFGQYCKVKTNVGGDYKFTYTTPVRSPVLLLQQSTVTWQPTAQEQLGVSAYTNPLHTTCPVARVSPTSQILNTYIFFLRYLPSARDTNWGFCYSTKQCPRQYGLVSFCVY